MASVTVSQKIYEQIVSKQMEIFGKFSRKIDLKIIADAAIKNGIEKVNEELGLIEK